MTAHRAVATSLFAADTAASTAIELMHHKRLMIEGKNAQRSAYSADSSFAVSLRRTEAMAAKAGTSNVQLKPRNILILRRTAW